MGITTTTVLCETGRLGASAAKDRDSSCTGGWDPYRKVVSTNLRTIGAEIGVLGEAGRLGLSVLSCTLGLNMAMGVGDGSTRTSDGSIIQEQSLCESGGGLQERLGSQQY
jgi:hypothetical protein